MNIPRITLSVGIDKHGALRLAEPLGKFRSELVASDNLDVWPASAWAIRRPACQPNPSSLRKRFP